MIDYKGGKVVWDNSHHWEKSEHEYDYDQDLLQFMYGEHCVIDVGRYYSRNDGHRFVIMVVDYRPYHNEQEKPDAWSNPYAAIPCQDKDDLLIQLQRAIDVYPEMMRRTK